MRSHPGVGALVIQPEHLRRHRQPFQIVALKRLFLIDRAQVAIGVTPGSPLE